MILLWWIAAFLVGSVGEVPLPRGCHVWCITRQRLRALEQSSWGICVTTQWIESIGPWNMHAVVDNSLHKEFVKFEASYNLKVWKLWTRLGLKIVYVRSLSYQSLLCWDQRIDSFHSLDQALFCRGKWRILQICPIYPQLNAFQCTRYSIDLLLK